MGSTIVLDGWAAPRALLGAGKRLFDSFDRDVDLYTVEHHTSPEPDDVKRFDDPADLRDARERAEGTTSPGTA